MKIHEEIAQEQRIYESDLQDGLDAASDHPSSSEVVEFKLAECDWLGVEKVDENVMLTGVIKTLPDDKKVDDFNIAVSKTIPKEKMEDGIEVNKDATIN